VTHHAALDARMVEAARDVRLLNLASWPAGMETDFVAEYARGVVRMPVIEYPRHDFSATRSELAAVAAEADPEHPLGQYLIDACRSWDTAAQLCEHLGTAAVTDLSIQLYRSPVDPLPGAGPGARVAARHFLSIADEFDRELLAPSEHVTISATALQLQLQRDLDDYFGERVI